MQHEHSILFWATTLASAASHTSSRRPRYHRSKRILSELAETADTATRALVGTRPRVGGPSSLSTASSSSRHALRHTEVTRQRARQLWALRRKQRRHLTF